LIVHLVLSDHFSPLFPLLKYCVTIPCISTHLVWCLRHSARIIIIIIIIIIHRHGHGIIDYPVYRFVCIGLGLGLAFVVEFGHGRSWQVMAALGFHHHCISLSFVVMGHGSVRPKASISISSGHGRPCRITAMELFSGHLLAGLPCQGIPLSLVLASK
jgi:hypothetical protein